MKKLKKNSKERYKIYQSLCLYIYWIYSSNFCLIIVLIRKNFFVKGDTYKDCWLVIAPLLVDNHNTINGEVQLVRYTVFSPASTDRLFEFGSNVNEAIQVCWSDTSTFLTIALVEGTNRYKIKANSNLILCIAN